MRAVRCKLDLKNYPDLSFKIVDTFNQYPDDLGFLGTGYTIEDFMLGSYPIEYLIQDGSGDPSSYMFNPRYAVVLISRN